MENEQENLYLNPLQEEELSFTAEYTRTPKPKEKKNPVGRPKSRGRQRPKKRSERFRPGERQKRQKGTEKREDALYYRRNRAERLWYQNEYNEINRDNPVHQEAIEWRRENERRIKRRASSEKVALEYLGQFFVIDKTPAKDLPQRWRDMDPIGVPRGNLDIVDLPEGTTTWVDGELRDHKIPGHPLDVDSYGGPGSSAKVIPYSGDFVNYTSWRTKNAAMNMGQILAGTEEEVLDRGYDYWPVLYRKGPRFLYFEVGEYKVRVYFPKIPLEQFREGIPRNLREEEVAFDCSCDFWRWQGPEHWAKVYGYKLGRPRGTGSVPRIKDPLGTKLVCKHVAAVIRRLVKK